MLNLGHFLRHNVQHQFIHHHFICSVKCKIQLKKKQENTEQGEPGSYERLRKPLHEPMGIQFEQSHTVKM